MRIYIIEDDLSVIGILEDIVEGNGLGTICGDTGDGLPDLSQILALAPDLILIDLLMPAMVLGSVSMAYIIRLTRSEISSNIAEDYVRTARAKGMSNGQVMLRHVLRNSLIPVVTYLGQDIGALMGGAMITEQIFNIHGIGFLTYQSILKGEANLVVSIVTLLMLIFVVCNLVVDMLYAALDPRIRYA